MSELDRSELVGLLEKLGAADDQEALAAARAAHARVTEAGVTWDDALRSMIGGAAETDSLSDDEEVAAPVLGDKADDAKLIDQVLARKGLSKELRQSLTELKQGLRDGSTDANDRRYIRALAKRLGV